MKIIVEMFPDVDDGLSLSYSFDMDKDCILIHHDHIFVYPINDFTSRIFSLHVSNVKSISFCQEES